MRVAIGQRVAQQGTVVAEEGEVAAPGVNADALDGDAALGCHLQTFDNLVIKGIEIPVKMMVERNEWIVKTRERFHAHTAVVERTDDGAT